MSDGLPGDARAAGPGTTGGLAGLGRQQGVWLSSPRLQQPVPVAQLERLTVGRGPGLQLGELQGPPHVVATLPPARPLAAPLPG